MKKLTNCLLLLLVLSLLLSACSPAQTPTEAPTDPPATEAPGPQIDRDLHSMRMEEILSLDDSLTWVFTGDSITHNGSWTQGMNGYAEWFEQYLIAAGRGNDSVINTAWGGADIQDFLPLSDTPRGNGMIADPGMGIEQFITKYNPDVVFVKLGMNNRGMSDEDFRTYYELMLKGIYAAGEENGKIPKVIILTSTPVSGDSIYNMEQTDYDSTWRIRDNLEQIAADWGLLFVDLQTAFTQEALVLGSDYAYTFYTDPSDGGLHQNGAGHYLIFKTLCKTLGLYDEEMPIFQLEYADFLYDALYVDDTAIESYRDDFDAFNWNLIAQSNFLWAVVGGQQMSGYQGLSVNRSLFRQLENGIRGGGNNIESCRDIRLLNLASPAYTMTYVAENYDAIIGEHQSIYNVLFLLPEVTEIYADGYAHSGQAVADYKAAVESIIAKNTDKLVVLWTPLASGDPEVNAIITDYAEAIRQIAANDPAVYFYDVNAFMNSRMTQHPSLASNWFEEGANITPLCALDLAYAFYNHTFMNGTNRNELKAHDLRLSSDSRTVRGSLLRDNIPAAVTVSGTTVTVDASAILAKYPGISDLRVAVLPQVGAGSYHSAIWTIAEFDGSTAAFEAPYSDPVITVYGELEGYTYRFKDQTVAVETGNHASKPAVTSETLTALEVIGAPAFDFDPAVTSYDIALYQYQQNVQIRAEAGENLTITVDGQEVRSGVPSQQIAVDASATVTVTAGGSTYTLNLTRPEYPDIIITEVMTDGYAGYTAEGGDNYDLIEIYNASGRDLNLLDYAIGYKKDYPYCLESATQGLWPYRFTGNDQTFHSTSSSAATYTGINPITKYSAYWNDGSVTEPEEILFPADSTMVIWVKYTPEKADESYASALTYDTLTAALQAHAGTHTLTVGGAAVVPAESQLVVAEVPVGEAAALTHRNGTPAASAGKNFYLENHGTLSEESSARSWLFILKASAEPASNGAITESGDDILSAARYIRLANSDKLSSVFSYHAERGLSLVKDLTTYDDAYTTGHTSDRQGYCNLTSFGAIEYWQKPADPADATAPIAAVNAAGAIRLTLTDDTDVRYLELYVRQPGEAGFTKVTQDFVLAAGMANAGVSADLTAAEFSYAASAGTEFYGFVVDGNGNTAPIGSETAPLTVN